MCYVTRMPFELVTTPTADEVIEETQRSEPRRYKKLLACLAKLEQDPHHPSLNSHRYEAFDKVYDQPVWESYVENRTPAAWRVWWAFGPERGQITVLDAGPHP